jgi:hypothetical protein
MENASRDAWAEVELGERRVLPALPGSDADLGEIRWERWERALVVTHIDPGCGTCGYGGPLACAQGMTLHQDPPRRRLLQRSRVSEGKRPVWGPVVTSAPRWVRTHWASRCQACDEMTVWCVSGVRPRCEECGRVSPDGLKGRLAQCPGCLRECRHLVPGRGWTWCEIAYHPPRVEATPVPSGGAAPQVETLF